MCYGTYEDEDVAIPDLLLNGITYIVKYDRWTLVSWIGVIREIDADV